MWREETVGDLSDGRFYTSNDLVKIGTDECRGCSDCCRMGPVIILDPLDVFELNRFLGQSFEELLNETIELKVIDGLILPVLKLVRGDEKSESADPDGVRESPDQNGAQEDAMVCPYLGADGRCTIHDFRPGICRLYPLGRSWENGDFRYILQVNECTHCTGTKVKVKKWLGIPNLAAYEDFCRAWHEILSSAQLLLEGSDPQSSLRSQVCVYLLRQFYLCDWNTDDFYGAFEQRRAQALHHLGFAS